MHEQKFRILYGGLNVADKMIKVDRTRLKLIIWGVFEIDDHGFDVENSKFNSQANPADFESSAYEFSIFQTGFILKDFNKSRVICFTKLYLT